MRILRFSLPAALLLAAASCSDKPEPQGPPPEVSEASPVRVRRLTRVEYDNSLASVVPGMPPLSATFAPEDTILGFSTHDRLQVTSLLADQMDNAAINASVYAFRSLNIHVQCPTDDEACTMAILYDVASRTFRRPLTDEDRAELLNFWRELRKVAAPQTAHQLFLQGLFSSASFLYRTELGEPGQGAGKVVRLTQHEVASALSYALTAAPPDEALRAAAEAGELQTAEQREAQARRLLATPAAQKRLHHFITEWLGITGLANINKNNQVFPFFSAAFKDSSRAETRTFIDHVLANEGGSVKELLSANYTFADGRMSAFYGTTSTPNGTTGRVPLPPERAGILTHASVLATYSLFDSSSPIRRGKFVLTRLLCQDIPPPPPSIVIIPPAVADDTTTRARFAAHSSSPSCQGCHRRLDPVGFGFENFDGLGKHRTQENGLTVDASGSVDYSAGTFTFTGGGELARWLANSEDVANCVPLQIFRYAMGREETPVDEQLLADMRAAFKANPRLQLGDALVSLVRSPYFTHRRTANE
ncbi:DUF1592 domain-containing protein [Myxococcus sp. RHSTA-1-4]|uniref:DUF1592 domain-containing protein n=1 Tax=Myxococcus sp. RHSTA-1-4 TaxID=2874601 RepID=UPI001CBB17DD|nr:DUF1592 domain-containing protein [Myxococcus sp. RHSTA-1-4]MBZ4416871.1 DUF1592 domain-containing protein [Myxococcus sp. RHSTA-1-4]